MMSASMMSTTAPHQPLSEYSLVPYSEEEVARFKLVLNDFKQDGCSPAELGDAYEALGLSQLLNGNYADAATNLECACTIQEDTLKTATEANVDHRHATKFWCGIAFMRVGQLEKAEAVYTHLVTHMQKKKSELFVAANSNLALLLVQLNRRKDVALKHAYAAVQVTPTLRAHAHTRAHAHVRMHVRLEETAVLGVQARRPVFFSLQATARVCTSRPLSPHTLPHPFPGGCAGVQAAVTGAPGPAARATAHPNALRGVLSS